MEKITLKKIVNHKNKHVVIPLMTGLFLAFYTACGALSYQSSVRLFIPEFEMQIPFIIDSIWIYIVLYPLYLIWALFGYKDIPQMNKTLFGFILLTILSCAIFLIFPVSYPRELFLLPLDNDISTILFRAMRSADKSNNCLPSLHVGLCFIFAYGYLKENKIKFYISFAISVIVSISTLTTKQHYIYDILTGFMISTLIYCFFSKYTEVKD